MDDLPIVLGLLLGVMFSAVLSPGLVQAPYTGDNIILIEGNTLKGNNPIFSQNWQVLGVLAQDVGLDTLKLSDEIIRRESNNNPKVCNKRYGCKAGMGLWGFISGTWNFTIDRMLKVNASLPERCQEKVSWSEQDSIPESQRTHPVFDDRGGCSDIIGLWLLKEDGIRHWESEDGSWGSGPYDDFIN